MLRPFSIVLVASESELRPADRVWGSGDWLPPVGREALDWLTLARLLGWGVELRRVGSPGLDAPLPAEASWVVLACDPDSTGEKFGRLLRSTLAVKPLLVIAPVAARGGLFSRLAGVAYAQGRSGGAALRWVGPGLKRSWRSLAKLEAQQLLTSKHVEPWALLDGSPAIVARRSARGVIATLAFHPSEWRDVSGTATALLKHLLIWGCPSPAAWLDLEGAMVLRMDDPGGAQNIYLRSWCYAKLGEAEWRSIAADLRCREARLSIGYVPGWVDDGDVSRGILTLWGRGARRVPGSIHPSPVVRYEDMTGHMPGTVSDYEAEFRGIQALRASGCGDVELHGYTHMHPDADRWAQASNRYECVSWFRELGPAAEAAIAALPPNRHPLALGSSLLGEYFGVRPTTLICPGDECVNSTLERALGLGFDLVDTYYLAIRDGERFCWSVHVCAPYLDQAASAWFESGLPVVGCFHDYEPAVHGVKWVARWLDEWRGIGARRFIDFRELAATVATRLCLIERDGDVHLMITRESAPALVRPLTIMFRLPSGSLPSVLEVKVDGMSCQLAVSPIGHGLGRVTLPMDHA